MCDVDSGGAVDGSAAAVYFAGKYDWVLCAVITKIVARDCAQVSEGWRSVCKRLTGVCDV